MVYFIRCRGEFKIYRSLIYVLKEFLIFGGYGTFLLNRNSLIMRKYFMLGLEVSSLFCFVESDVFCN